MKRLAWLFLALLLAGCTYITISQSRNIDISVNKENKKKLDLN